MFGSQNNTYLMIYILEITQPLEVYYRHIVVIGNLLCVLRSTLSTPSSNSHSTWSKATGPAFIMLGIQRELPRLVLEHSLNKYLSPNWVPGIKLSTETFILVGPHLRHTTNLTGHAQGKFM